MMKKTILSLLLLCCATLVGAQNRLFSNITAPVMPQTTQSAASLRADGYTFPFGYVFREQVRIEPEVGIGTQKTDPMGLGILVTPNQKLGGAQLEAIEIAFNCGQDEEFDVTAVIFNVTANKLEASKTQKLGTGWSIITLDAPYTIPMADNIVVGYYYTPKAKTDYYLGVQSNLVENTNALYMVDATGGTIKVTDQHGNLPGYGAGIFLHVTDPQGAYANRAILTSAYPVEGYYSDKATPYVLSISNTGSNELSSVTFSMKDPAGNEQTWEETFDTPLAKGAVWEAPYSEDGGQLPIFKDGGVYTLAITQANGQANSAPVLDKQYRFRVNETFLSDKCILKTSLVEKVTGEWCGWCPSGTVYLNGLKEVVQKAGYDFNVVDMHNGGEDFMGFFDIVKMVAHLFGNPSYPNIILDRTANVVGNVLYVFSPQDLGALFSPDYTATKIEGKFTLNEDDHTADVVIDVTNIDPDKSTDGLYLNVVVLENNIPWRNQAFYDASVDKASYRHNHTLRQYCTDVYGDAMTFTDNKFHREMHIALPTPFSTDYDNFDILVYVTGKTSDTKSIEDWYVRNSLLLHGANGVGVQSPVQPAADNYVIYAQDGQVKVQGEYDAFTVYSLNGTPVSGTLPAGAYIVRVEHGADVFVGKVVVK